jgi:hypothetical protein
MKDESGGSAVAVLLRALRLRRDKGRQIMDFGFWMMDFGLVDSRSRISFP